MSRYPEALHLVADRTEAPLHADLEEGLAAWLPFVGPTATLLHLLLVRSVEGAPAGQASTDVSMPLLAVMLGVDHHKVELALGRLERFGFVASVSADVLSVRVLLPTPGPRLTSRLPEPLRAVLTCHAVKTGQE